MALRREQLDLDAIACQRLQRRARSRGRPRLRRRRARGSAMRSAVVASGARAPTVGSSSRDPGNPSSREASPDATRAASVRLVHTAAGHSRRGAAHVQAHRVARDPHRTDGAPQAQRARVSRIRRPSAPDRGVVAAELAREVVQVLRLGAAHLAQRAVDRDAPSGGSLAPGGAMPCSASQRGRYSPATLPAGHHSGAPSASPRPREPARARRRRAAGRAARARRGRARRSAPASRAIAAAARRAWCVARPPNLTGETTPSPAAHVRSRPRRARRRRRG